MLNAKCHQQIARSCPAIAKTHHLLSQAIFSATKELPPNTYSHGFMYVFYRNVLSVDNDTDF